MEKLFRKINSIGAASVVCGIISIVSGVAVGVLMVVNGGRLLSEKPEKQD